MPRDPTQSNPGQVAEHARSAGAVAPEALARLIKGWGLELGFQQVGIADTDLTTAEARLTAWLARAITAPWITWHATGPGAVVRGS